MPEADEFLQRLNFDLLLLNPLLLPSSFLLLPCELFSQRGDLRLLFFEGIDKDGAQAVVLDPIDLATTVACGEQRLDRVDVFGGEPEIERIV